ADTVSKRTKHSERRRIKDFILYLRIDIMHLFYHGKEKMAIKMAAAAEKGLCASAIFRSIQAFMNFCMAESIREAF
ncbi:MAG: hypothetical protein IJO53_02780, partial [Clostridia bacterium]|nr:hypothetical protein [Clostridia bacterium]